MIQILQADARAIPLADGSVNCCVTSPPYFGLRDYGIQGQIGLEATPDAYVAEMVKVFREVRRVLKDDGVLWLNLGDSYSSQGGAMSVEQKVASGAGTGNSANIAVRARTTIPGLKPKDLIGIPWRVAFALQADGWYLRSDIIWAKPNCMPESVRDRCTRSHEYIFMLTKSATYWYDADAIAEPAAYSGITGMDATGYKDSEKFQGKHGSTLTGGAHGRHHLGDAIPEKQRRTDKQRGHTRRHAGFNDRWDQMERAEQCSGMRNKRDVWTIPPAQFPEAHFATFPEALVEPCIMAGCPKGGTVLDPFGGSGTTAAVSNRLGRSAVILELNPAYIEIAKRRCFADVTLTQAEQANGQRLLI